MNSPKIIKNIAITLFILLFSVPAFSAEQRQPLLAELSRQLSTEPADKESISYLTDGVPYGLVEQPENSALFTMEEINEGTSTGRTLVLPDVDLPVSDIPLTLNSKVEYFLYYFQGKGQQSFSKWLSRSARYIPMMKELLKKEGMPEDLVYVAMIESGFQMNAKSWASAVGPWQFMSATGRNYSLRIDEWIDERKDPVKATTAAAMYLKNLYSMFKGDWYLATAGYNAGENKIMRAINMYNTSDFWEISHGSYLKQETKDYVPKLLAAAIIAKDPTRYGFSNIAYLAPLEFDTVKIPSRTDLEVVAKLTNSTYETIKELNPELRHWCTPPNYPDYLLKIPKGTQQQFLEGFAKIPEDKRFTEKTLYTHYRARKKDTLKTIAKRYNTTSEKLADLNGLSAKSRIAGKNLVVPVKQTVNFRQEGQVKNSKPATKAYDKYYTVKKGDTLNSLAKKFDISEKLLSAWNSLKGKVALKPGRRLIVARFVEKNGEMVSANGKS